MQSRGTVLLVLAIPIGVLDNILRPILIRRGVQLPMLLIIAGVIGGLIGFGVMGLFVGPVLLAATYTLAKSWVAEGQPPPTRSRPRETLDQLAAGLHPRSRSCSNTPAACRRR